VLEKNEGFSANTKYYRNIKKRLPNMTFTMLASACRFLSHDPFALHAA
jgi:hypothetical protein